MLMFAGQVMEGGSVSFPATVMPWPTSNQYIVLAYCDTVRTSVPSILTDRISYPVGPVYEE